MAYYGQRIYLNPGVTGQVYFGASQPLKNFWWQYRNTCGQTPPYNNSNQADRQHAYCPAGTSDPPAPGPCSGNYATLQIQGVQWCPDCNGPEQVFTPWATDPADPVKNMFFQVQPWYEWLTVTMLDMQYKLGANQDYVWGNAEALASGNNVIVAGNEDNGIAQPRVIYVDLTIPAGFGNSWYNQPDCGKFGFTTEIYADAALNSGEHQYGEMKWLQVAKQRILVSPQ